MKQYLLLQAKMDKEIKKDILQWDVESWSAALDFWEQEVDWTKVERGLELGGRQGGLSLWLALKGKESICSDLKNVQETAEILHKKYGMEKRIQYRDIDATEIPYENHFDIIVFKSILGGVGHNDNKAMQEKAILQMHKALKPGGVLLFAENLKASPFHQFVRKKFTRWGKYWRYVSQNELQEFLSPFSKVKMHTTGVTATFGRSENQRNFLSKCDKLLFNKTSCPNWKYMGYGIAVK